MSGDVYGPYYFGPGAGNASVPVDDLVNDPAGGVDVDIPVNAPSGGLSFVSTGVYPVQAFLENNGVRVGQPLTTFIVYVGKDVSTLRRLETVLVVPLAAREPIGQTGMPAPVPAASANVLEADAAELYLWHVPVTIRAAAPTVASLAESGAAGRDMVGELREALAAGDELLPTTQLPVDLAALVSAGLTGDLQEQMSSGTSTLARLLGQAPSPSTWAFSGGVNTATMSALVGMGVTQVAVPEGDLSALPPAAVTLTFSLPTELAVQGKTIRVMGADSELSARTAQASVPGLTALVANQVLAELAMVDLEAPGHLRGIVVAPPPGAELSPGFLSVVLAGLHDNPLLDAVPLAQMFRDLSVAAQANGRPLVRQLEGQDVAPLGGTELLATARATVSADGELYGRSSPLVGTLDQELEVSLSSAFSTSQRGAMIGAALPRRRVRPVQSQVAALDLHHPNVTARTSPSDPAVERRNAREGAAHADQRAVELRGRELRQRRFVPPRQPWFGGLPTHLEPLYDGPAGARGGAHQRRLPVGAAAGHALGLRADRGGHRHRAVNGHLRRRPGPYGERRTFSGRLVGPQRSPRPPGTPAGATSG